MIGRRDHLNAASVTVDFGLVIRIDEIDATLRIAERSTIAHDGRSEVADLSRVESLPFDVDLLEDFALAWTEDGALKLDAPNGLSIDVPPSPDFEAWELSFRNGASIISRPGGGLIRVPGRRP